MKSNLSNTIFVDENGRLNNGNNLEEKINKIDWKQWAPIYGVYKVIEANIKGKPALNDGPILSNSLRYFGSMVYHAIVSWYPASEIIEGIKNLIK